MAVSSTTTTKEREHQEKKVSVDFFHIDMIPDAMDKMKWPVAAKLMRHWFDTKPSFSYTAQSKKVLKMPTRQHYPNHKLIVT